MPNGYYLAYVAKEDVPYWHYVIGQGPKANNVSRTLPKAAWCTCKDHLITWEPTRARIFTVLAGSLSGWAISNLLPQCRLIPDLSKN